MTKLGLLSGLKYFATFAVYPIGTVVSQISGPVTAAAKVFIAVTSAMFYSSVYGGGLRTSNRRGRSLGKGK